MRNVYVYILRHGETNENAQRIIQGQLNTQLNDRGRDQARVVGRALKDVPFTHAFTSDLSRAADTARIILEHHLSITLQESADLRERHLGTRQGQLAGSPKNKGQHASMEPHERFLARLRDFWVAQIMPLCVSDLPQPDANVLVVSHGAAIASLVFELLIPNKYEPLVDCDRRRIWNTSVTQVALVKDETETRIATLITRFADISHLVEKPVARANADVEESNEADKEGETSGTGAG